MREALEEVLARPAYDDLRPGLAERVLDALSSAFRGLLGTLSGTGQGGWLGGLILAGSALALLWLLVRLLSRIRRDPTVRNEPETELGRTPASWRQEAEERAAAGRWREALRCHYRATVAELAGEGLVAELPGRTAGEYLRAVRAALPAASHAFAALTAAFDAAWYGAAEVGAPEVARAAELADEVRRVQRTAEFSGKAQRAQRTAVGGPG